MLHQSHVTAWCARVSGFLPGSRLRQEWFTVFDGRGFSVSGAPGESLATVQVRYANTAGVPAKWQRLRGPMSCVELANAASYAEREYAARLANPPLPPGSGKRFRLTVPLPKRKPA